MRIGGVLVLLLAIAGCGYRGAAPVPLGEPVAVAVVEQRGRLVRSQAFLQDQVARELARSLGWQVAPGGPARLELVIHEEAIDVVASGDLGIPERWRAKLSGTWTLRPSAGDVQRGRFAGNAFYDDRAGEPRALREAATSAARQLVAQLRRRSSGRDAQPGIEH